ncbi:hypothetical protein [Ramlibacter sp. 2FC]|uniref:hypothetical protein n=1 Tax=Ramlibacter sp. 2FC TaxID=2502188 RepID=UPI0010F9C92C|nr:hypothetical protein [Ramlibacter sp. 2FC]
MTADRQQAMAEAGVEARAAEPLLALVEDHRRQLCERLLAQAQDQAQAIVAQGRAEARQHLHRAVQQERARAHGELAAARAHWQTLRRRHQQAQQAALLAAAWESLGAALRRRWRDPAARRAWIAKLLREALATLPGGTWEIRHPPDLPEDELQRMREGLPLPPQCLADAELTAGLCIRSDHVVLDGSLEGLASERTRLQGQLLAALGAEA